MDDTVGKICQLLKPIRTKDGAKFNERPRILREIHNLDRIMYLVQFADGSTSFLFPDEIKII